MLAVSMSSLPGRFSVKARLFALALSLTVLAIMLGTLEEHIHLH
jgi:hypothetical protein